MGPFRNLYYLVAQTFYHRHILNGKYADLERRMDEIYRDRIFNSFGGKIKSIFDINILSPSHFYLSKKGKLEDKL